MTHSYNASRDYIEHQYALYLQDKENIESTWRHFFEGMEFAERGLVKAPSSHLRIFHLIDAYRRYGHLMATFNPLSSPSYEPIELSLNHCGLSENDRDSIFPTGGLLGKEKASLKEILQALKETYCGTIGIEYKGLDHLELENWIQKEVEKTHSKPYFSLEKKKTILEQLNKAELFEIFLHKKYVGQKRFSLEGGETLIPLLHEAIETGSKIGANEFVIGMPHRGRLNVLANILNKSYTMIFSEFEDFYEADSLESMGDVKYHKGFSSDITVNQKSIHLSITANPSHLESVNPIVEGKVRAKQIQKRDALKTQVIPILIHGDASISGQGVVYECMQLFHLEGYSTGGTIHIVVNNQIGFTALPKETRSTRYCTDIAKAFSAPIFHVNAEDPEGCVYAMQMAIEIRQKFHCDVFIDLNCYRKYGHNESDEPLFTQPIEYQKIRNKKSIREIYKNYLLKEGTLEKETVEALEEEFEKKLHTALEEIKISKKKAELEAFEGAWKVKPLREKRILY